MVDLHRLHGDHPDYFRVLTEEYGPMLLCIARRYAVDLDEADDLYQQIWLHVWRQRKNYTGRGSFPGWLRRVATNLCTSLERRRASETAVLRRLELERRGGRAMWQPRDPKTVVARNRRLRNLRDALNRLPERQRIAIELRIMDELSGEEAGAEMGVAPATVRSLVRHGIHRLKTLFESSDDEMPRNGTAD